MMSIKTRNLKITLSTLLLGAVINACAQDIAPDAMPVAAKHDVKSVATPVVEVPGNNDVVEFVNNRLTKKQDAKKQKVLFIGDSLTEGLARRFADYSEQNGYEQFSVIWYGSTTKSWATTKDMQYYIDNEKPTFIILSLGTNDLGYHDLSRREEYVKEIIRKFGDIPFVWVGPVNLFKDPGIGAIIERNVGKGRFFKSNDFTYAKASDGIHPTLKASAQWMDRIANWLTSDATDHPLMLEKPTQSTAFKNYVRRTPRYKGML